MKREIPPFCRGCRYLYASASVPGIILNLSPLPVCHLFEATGRTPSGECFSPRRKITMKKEK